MPQISIIVPIYKVEKYLSECVNSLTAQTFTDIEIILVDDGSPDNCGAMCDEFAKQDKRITVIHKKNGGLSSARNAGIKAATGNYICFVDSDDLVSADYCKSLFELIDGTEYDYAVGGVYRFKDGAFTEPSKPEKEVLAVGNIQLLEMQIDRKSEFGVWNKLYKREIFDSLQFADGRLNEDVIWSSDIAAHCKNGAILTNEPVYYYRMREGGIVSQQAAKGSVDRIYAGRHLVEQAEKYYPELKEKALNYALNYPWSFADKIVIAKAFKQNKAFLDDLRSFISAYKDEIKVSSLIPQENKHRMLLFSKAKPFYYINAYIRLIRVYLFKFLKKDPYHSLHKI